MDEAHTAKVLETYVCKSLREHNLLQAIARVNRLYEDDGQEKQFGFIIDYEAW